METKHRHIAKQIIWKHHNDKDMMEFKATKNVILNILKNSIYFVLFSLLNVTLPIFITLISANLASDGAYAAMGIGFVTTFFMGFSQVGFTFAIFSSLFYFRLLKNKNKNFDTDRHILIYDTLLLALIYGIIITPIYIGSSYVYTKYANAHYNTIDSLDYAYDFIYSSALYVFLITILYSLVINIHNKKGQIHGIIHMILIFALILILSSTLGILTDLKGKGLGLGMSIGVLIGIISTFIHNYFFTDTFKDVKLKIRKSAIFLILDYTWRPMVSSLSIQIFKGCALLLLSFQIPDELVNSVPLDYQMSRIIWYNMMYLIPFIFLGMADSIYFFFIKEGTDILKNANKSAILLIIGSLILILTILIILFGIYVMDWLAYGYTKNQSHSYDDLVIINNLNSIGRSKIVDLINKDVSIPNNLKPYLIDYVQNKLSDEVINNLLKESGFSLKFTSFNKNNIIDILTFPKSFTYFYLSVYCILYPAGQYISAFSLAITKRNQNTILLTIAQALAILFVVEFGINYQEGQTFYLMQAWSFPLLIIGIVAIVYLSFTSFVYLMEYDKKMMRNEYLNLMNDKKEI